VTFGSEKPSFLTCQPPFLRYQLLTTSSESNHPVGTDPWTSVLSTLAPGELERLYHHLHLLHREFSPDANQGDSTDLPSPPSSPTMSGHHRSDSSEVREPRQPTNPRAPSATTPAATPREEDPLSAVYRAIAEDPELVNKLADAIRANPGGLRGPRGLTGAPGAPGTGDGGGHWRADEVGFFFPDLHHSYGTTAIVTSNGFWSGCDRV
jgi:hypothetical protein